MFKLIAIIEKSHIIREGLTVIINANNICKQLACLENLEDWEHAFKNNKPDVVIINPDYARGEHGIEKLKTKLHLADNTIFMGLVYHYYEPELLRSFADIIYITDKDSVVTSKLQHMGIAKAKESTGNERLTDREKDVLRLLLQGFSNKEVADKLIISPHTVITHRKNIVEKTGIRSLSGLAVYAIINNISDMDHIQQ